MTLTDLDRRIERYRQERAQHDQIRQREVLAMALKPRVRVKALGIPIGNFDVIADAMGKMRVKPKRKPPGQTLNQQYASRNKKKWKAAK